MNYLNYKNHLENIGVNLINEYASNKKWLDAEIFKIRKMKKIDFESDEFAKFMWEYFGLKLDPDHSNYPTSQYWFKKNGWIFFIPKNTTVVKNEIETEVEKYDSGWDWNS